MPKKYKESIKVKDIGRKIVDFSGTKVYDLLIDSPYGVDKNGFVIYNCTCICGENIKITFNRILRNNLKSCGCKKNTDSRKGKIPFNRIRDPKICCLNATLSAYKNNARMKKRDFTLTREQVSKLIFSRCYYCNSEPNNVHKRSYCSYKYNGIDRIDSFKGYVIDNCRTCCSMCNFMKKEFTEDVFLKHISKINNFMKSKI